MALKLGFILISIICWLLLYLAARKEKRILVICIIWLTIVGVLAYSGFFEINDDMPPKFVIAVLGGVMMVVYYFRIIEIPKIDFKMLLLIHVLRIPVEISLHQLFSEKQIPKIMTYEGWNFDILMGISALVIFAYLHFSKKELSNRFLWVWNIVGVVMLLTIVVIAILSAPLPIQQFGFDQPNLALVKFPFIFLPAFIVPIVFLSHFLAIKKLTTHTDK